MIPDYLKVIKLGYGLGEPGKRACWMTALNSHIGGKWSDQCDCVDPVINCLCIVINDLYKDDETRTRDILEFGLFEPLGTKGREKDTWKRYYKAFDWLATKITGKNHEIIDNESLQKALNSGVLNSDIYSPTKIPYTLRYYYDSGLFKPKDIFSLLRELIDMGPHAPVEQTCDIEKFHELVGVK